MRRDVLLAADPRSSGRNSIPIVKGRYGPSVPIGRLRSTDTSLAAPKCKIALGICVNLHVITSQYRILAPRSLEFA